MSDDIEKRRIWCDGWDDGLKFGRKQGRAAERARWRRLVRNLGAAEALKQLMRRKG